MVYNSVCGNKS